LEFRKSWEYHNELVVNDALITLLNSRVCKDLKAFCGYPSLQILNNLPEKISKMRISLGKNSDPVSIIEELKCRRQRHLSMYDNDDMTAIINNPDEGILVHLRCGELDPKKLTPLPDSTTKIFISDVTDDDVDWVLQATISLVPKKDIEGLILPRSKLTAAGVEGIAKGLADANLNSMEFGVSSPFIIHKDSEDWSDVDSEDSAEDDGLDEDSLSFAEMLTEKYDFVDVFLNNESRMDFIKFNDYIPKDLRDDFIKKLRELKTKTEHDY